MIAGEILKMIVAAVISLLVASAVAYLIRRLREPFEMVKILRNTGLKRFLPTEKFDRLDIPEKDFCEGQSGDEILIIGRTLRLFLENQHDAIIEGLKRGLDFKILILNPQKLKNQRIGLDPLQLNKPGIIATDLHDSLKLFQAICEEAQQQKHRGSFEVRVSDYVIINSLTSITQHRKLPAKSLRKLILDFSFSQKTADKYRQYYECNPGDDDHFGNKLYRFYLGSYLQSKPYFKYSEFVLQTLSSTLHEVISNDLKDIAAKYNEGEELRGNQSYRLLPVIPNLLASIREGKMVAPPLSVQFELNNECNTHCRPCKRHLWPKSDVLNTTQVSGILNQLANLGIKTITFSGGEPTLRPDFPEILRQANENGLRIGVLTNGLQLDPTLAGEMVRHADWVRISLDAASETTYYRVRGVKNGLEQVVESIHNLDTARRTTGRECRIGICYTLQSANIDEAEKMPDFVKSLGLGTREKVLTFKFVHGHDGFLCSIPKLLEFKRKVIDNSNPTLDQWTNIPYLKKFLGGDYSNERDIADGQPILSFYRENHPRCFTPYMFSLIDAYGDVFPCCFMYYDNEGYEKFKERRSDYRMGRLKDMSFAQIWQGENYSHFRNELSNIDINNYHECRECTRHYLHNAFISEVTALYDRYNEDYGADAGDIYKLILQQNFMGEIWL